MPARACGSARTGSSGDARPLPAGACAWRSNRNVSPQTSTDVTSSSSIEQHGQLNGSPTWSADHDNGLCKLGRAVITLCSFCDHGSGCRPNHPCTGSQSETMPSPSRFSMRTIAERPPTLRASVHRARGFLGPSLVSAAVCTGPFLSECIALQGPPGQCLVVVSPWL